MTGPEKELLRGMQDRFRKCENNPNNPSAAAFGRKAAAIETALKEVERCERLEALARELWECRHEELDGQNIADMLVDHGIAKWTTAEAPCAEEGCLCAEVGEFPTGCLRRVLETK